MLWSVFLADFFDDKVADLRSARSTEFYRDNFKRFVRWCEARGLRDTDQLTAQTVRDYLSYLTTEATTRYGKPPASASLHSWMRAIRAPLRWGVENGYLEAAVISRFKMPKVDHHVIEIFSDRHIQALYDACTDQVSPKYQARDAAILALLLDTGIRASELCTLTMDRLFLDRQDPFVRVVGKGRKERDVGPLGDVTLRRLRLYLHRYRKSMSPYVFVSHRNAPLTRLGLDKILYRLRDKAEVVGVRVSAHTFRHTYACRFLTRPGADIFKLQQLLGHTEIATTQVYLRAFDQGLARRGLTSITDGILS